MISVNTDFGQKLDVYQSEINQDINERINFIRKQVEGAKAKGVVVGISGGIDSAVVAALAMRALGSDQVLGVWMPANSHPQHAEDAKLLAANLGLKLITVNLDTTSDVILEAIGQGLVQGHKITSQQDLSVLTKGNTKARLRMTTLYAIAGQLGYLVAGTCNRTEIHLGYETKGGDQICDFNPVSSLVKGQIRIMAKELGVPQRIIEKAPSADLWEGQTDEDEMGFTYEQVDSFLLTGVGDTSVKDKVQEMHQKSQHKRQMPPSF